MSAKNRTIDKPTIEERRWIENRCLLSRRREREERIITVDFCMDLHQFWVLLTETVTTLLLSAVCTLLARWTCKNLRGCSMSVVT